METVILASASPRRSELLTMAGIPFETRAASVDEQCAESAASAVRILSARKALAVSSMYTGRYVLGADTLVELDGEVLGKPAGPAEAAAMLRRLSGHTHRVHTGVTVVSPDGTVITDGDCSLVTFDEMSDREIESYVASGEPLDKAGAYAVQGRAALWISRLEGCASSVIGLPLPLVRSLLLRSGYSFD